MRRGAGFGRCASTLLSALLSCLLAFPVGSVAGNGRAMTEEEQPTETTTEENFEAISCPVQRQDWLEGHNLPAASPLAAAPQRLTARHCWRANRPLELAGRNGCGGPLRC